MIKILENITIKAPISMRAIVKLDCDIDAERVILMHRNTCEVYYNFKLSTTTPAFVVPYSHALNNTLLIGILDDNAVYNCSFADGIQAENVNVNAV